MRSPRVPRPSPRWAQCDDTDAMVSALASGADTINIGAAGTAMRFLTAYFAATGAADGAAVVTLDGSERMRERPIGALVDALRACGASIDYVGREGYPPLRITRKRLLGGEISVPASISSQYVSALLMVAPCMERGLTLHLEGEIMSLPYIRMTLAMMGARGAELSLTSARVWLRLLPEAIRPRAACLSRPIERCRVLV